MKCPNCGSENTRPEGGFYKGHGYWDCLDCGNSFDKDDASTTSSPNNYATNNE